MERILNADFMTYVTCDDPDNILEAQIAFLVSRFDILLESGSVANNSGQFIREHLFSRPYRFVFIIFSTFKLFLFICIYIIIYIYI